ncbi:hypothetical protein Gohar_001406, partial [Gossypium harknessii]|nr:hypothetical protein [Gossypium harknessii]
MSGIMHKIEETLHMGGHKKEEEKHKGEAHHEGGHGQGYGAAEHKGEVHHEGGHGYGYGPAEHKGEVHHEGGHGYGAAAAAGHGHGEQHKEGFMDKIKDKIHGEGGHEP